MRLNFCCAQRRQLQILKAIAPLQYDCCAKPIVELLSLPVNFKRKEERLYFNVLGASFGFLPRKFRNQLGIALMKPVYVDLKISSHWRSETSAWGLTARLTRWISARFARRIFTISTWPRSAALCKADSPVCEQVRVWNFSKCNQVANAIWNFTTSIWLSIFF